MQPQFYLTSFQIKQRLLGEVNEPSRVCYTRQVIFTKLGDRSHPVPLDAQWLLSVLEWTDWKINPNMEILVWTPLMVHRHFIKFAFTLFSIHKQTAWSIFHSVLSEIPPAFCYSACLSIEPERKRVRCLKLAPHLRIGYFGTLVVYLNSDSNTVPNRRAVWRWNNTAADDKFPGSSDCVTSNYIRIFNPIKINSNWDSLVIIPYLGY